ncbi:M61 family metallopeptidase [Alcaligenaceae bacterium]|nr:M61 family metallopeptidase [Alcaligenaceae bacterium]
MKNEYVLYTVTPCDLAGHRLDISLTIQNPDPGGQLLAMPAWIPGSYLIRDFSRQVETIRAHSAGQTVAISKSSTHAWQCAPCDGPLTIDYTIYAWDLSVRSAHVDETHAFFNGTSVYLSVNGQEQLPCHVRLCPPPRTQARSWRVYTSLPEATGHPQAARRYGFGMYVAPNYDALVDHPVEMGLPQVARFRAHGAQHELVFTGVAPNLDLKRIVADVKRICASQITFFEPESNKPPFLDSSDRYVFMTMVTDDGYGGLEHRASTALMAGRRDLPVVGRADAGAGYQTFLGLVSHEYFHTWNIKRIKPAAFAPYRFDRPNHTSLLWVFEGFTSYYDDLMLLRSGVVTETDYLRMLGKAITSVHGTPGRTKQSVAESSFDTWTRFYKQDENSPNALVSYYTKGSLIALGLDLLIRNETDGQRSLDDVMQLMWTRFGRDFYQNGSEQGVSEDAMPQIILEATGVDVSSFIEHYVLGREDVPLHTLFAAQNIAMNWAPVSALPTLDLRVRAEHGETRISTVLENGAAHAAGLSAGDSLVTVNGLRVSDPASLDRLLAAYRPGDKVKVHVFRRDELRVFTAVLGEPVATQCTLERMEELPAS